MLNRSNNKASPCFSPVVTCNSSDSMLTTQTRYLVLPFVQNFVKQMNSHFRGILENIINRVQNYIICYICLYIYIYTYDVYSKGVHLLNWSKTIFEAKQTHREFLFSVSASGGVLCVFFLATRHRINASKRIKDITSQIPNYTINTGICTIETRTAWSNRTPLCL